MSARAVLAGAAILVASSSAGWTQSWGFGIEVGPPVYYGPPPVYAYEVDPYYYEQPPVYYEPPPVVVVPPPMPRYTATPDAVLDMLEAEGYSELSPMAERGAYYKLSAVSPEGDLVALEISIRTGEIEQEIILEPSRGPAPRAVAATPPPVTAPAPPPGAAPAPMRERLQPPASGKDPLVIY